MNRFLLILFFIYILGATPPRMRRRCHAPSAPPVRERDPLLEADREAERKYRELIREAEKLLVTVSRAPIEPPHNPRIRELRATEVKIYNDLKMKMLTHIVVFVSSNLYCNAFNSSSCTHHFSIISSARKLALSWSKTGVSFSYFSFYLAAILVI